MLLAFVMALLSPLALGSLIVDVNTMRAEPRNPRWFAAASLRAGLYFVGAASLLGALGA